MKVTSKEIFKSLKTETNSVQFISLRKTLKTPFPLAYSRIRICKGTSNLKLTALLSNISSHLPNERRLQKSSVARALAIENFYNFQMKTKLKADA